MIFVPVYTEIVEILPPKPGCYLKLTIGTVCQMFLLRSRGGGELGAAEVLTLT